MKIFSAAVLFGVLSFESFGSAPSFQVSSDYFFQVRHWNNWCARHPWKCHHPRRPYVQVVPPVTVLPRPVPKVFIVPPSPPRAPIVIPPPPDGTSVLPKPPAAVLR